LVLLVIAWHITELRPLLCFLEALALALRCLKKLLQSPVLTPMTVYLLSLSRPSLSLEE